MKKIWGYISAFLAGALTIAIIAWQKGQTKIVYHIKRLKLKNSPEGKIIVDTESTPEVPETGTLSKRYERKQARIIKRNEKKLKKVEKRLGEIL